MKELKCPKCGNVFSVDDADYESLVSQVKNAEFAAELERRVSEMHEKMQTEQKLAEAQKAGDFRQQLAEETAKTQQKQAEVERLTQQLQMAETLKKAEIAAALAQKETELEAVKQKANNAVLVERQKQTTEKQEKELEIERLKNENQQKLTEAAARETNLKQQYEQQLKMAQQEVEFYKDLKTRMSTKMVGETLEIHCSTLFEQNIRPLMPNAYFEKDNDASEGSKGDFIFRDKQDDVEYISIMFEMKNEMDTTASKHKNEDFFKKLDEDRRKKNCEYAVLVTMLEPDSELYNGGIVDVSHRYEKMYVIRPQFFIPMITLLTQAGKKSLDYKRQLAIAKSQTVDVTNFENDLNDFKDKFGRNYRLAHEKFDTAIEEIDKSIAHLQKIKEALQGSDNNLRLALGKVDDLTIKRLTRNNPTMRKKFEEAAAANAVEDVTDSVEESDIDNMSAEKA